MNVKFNFRDSRGRPTSRTYWNTATVLSDVLSDVTTFAPLLNALTDLALESITVSVKSTTTTFAGAAVSNIDENVSLKVLGGDGWGYDVDLPDVPDLKTPSGVIALTDADLLAFAAAFAVAEPWRINLRNPTTIGTLVSATLDK